jgi:hypothetical protein
MLEGSQQGRCRRHAAAAPWQQLHSSSWAAPQPRSAAAPPAPPPPPPTHPHTHTPAARALREDVHPVAPGQQLLGRLHARLVQPRAALHRQHLERPEERHHPGLLEAAVRGAQRPPARRGGGGEVQGGGAARPGTWHGPGCSLPARARGWGCERQGVCGVRLGRQAGRQAGGQAGRQAGGQAAHLRLEGSLRYSWGTRDEMTRGSSMAATWLLTVMSARPCCRCSAC